MKTLTFIICTLITFDAMSWTMTHENNGKTLRCPPKYIPIISEFEKHFTIPLGGTKGSAYIYDMITTDFVARGRFNGGRIKYYMHCAKFIKSDCHHCEPNKKVHENYCVHYIHPTEGYQQGCLARGVIPYY